MRDTTTVRPEPSRETRTRGGRRAKPIPERLLAGLWRKRAARKNWLRTRGGTRVRVIYPGRPSRAAGPDFRNALLEMEGVGLVHGDVEIHVRQRDWAGHGHGSDPNYNGVVLHAALEVDSPMTGLQSGGTAPVVCLAPLLKGEDPLDDVPSDAGMWVLLGRHGYARPGSPGGLSSLLDRAGDDRFLSKSACFQLFLEEQPPDQTLYEGLMEGLGYRHNTQPFLKLASRAPYAALERAARGLAPERRTGAIDAWLAALAGLSGPAGGVKASPPGAGFGAALSAGEWHCFRVRPSNHPRRRIRGAAGLLDRFLDEGLAAGLGAVAAAAGPRKLTAALLVEGGPGRDGAPVGLGRARDLAVNVVLPFLHALGGRRAGAPSREACLALYRRFGKLQENELTREMAGRLLDPPWGGVFNTARRQQGLLHLHSLLTGGS